jgi:hypothetical protein
MKTSTRDLVMETSTRHLVMETSTRDLVMETSTRDLVMETSTRDLVMETSTRVTVEKGINRWCNGCKDFHVALFSDFAALKCNLKRDAILYFP